jgi:5'-deoxynucleotidase YfbR-like HD superfamily hydrolase
MITIRTYTGIEIGMLAPSPSHINVADIARGLSMICRFNGQALDFYSVAEHSVLVASILRAWGMDVDVIRAGLLHDAHEAYIGDVTSPMKRALRIVAGGAGSNFDAVEVAWERAVELRFGLTQQRHEAVKRADLEALAIEDHVVRGLPRELTLEILPRPECLSPRAAERLFLDACVQWGVR